MPGEVEGGGRGLLGLLERERGQLEQQGPGPQCGWGEAVSSQPSFAGLGTHSDHQEVKRILIIETRVT